MIQHQPVISGYFSVNFKSQNLTEEEQSLLENTTNCINIDYAEKTINIKLTEYSIENRMLVIKILSQLLTNTINIVIKKQLARDMILLYPIINLHNCEIISWKDINDISLNETLTYDIRFKFEKVKFQWK